MKLMRAFWILLAIASLQPRVALGDWPYNPLTNLPVCTAVGSQYTPVLAEDGTGGAIVTWEDYRNGNWDIYAQHVLVNGAVDPAWPLDGQALCTAVNNQNLPTIVADGAGGAIVTWYDLRSGTNYDIYAQHILASGALDPSWPTDGRALCTAAYNQDTPAIVADGAGGAIVTWQDYRSGGSNDIYAQHVLANGTSDPAWPADGRAICTAAFTQLFPKPVSDGAGGAIITWQDIRGGANYDIYAQHVLANGAVDGVWPFNGLGVCTVVNEQYSPAIVADGTGGAIITWFDYRNGNFYDIYALHVLATGALDPAWPANGSALCTAAGNQLYPAITTDGTGGAIVTWYDLRNGNYDIYAQHLLAGGNVDLTWPADGRGLCIAGGDQLSPVIVSDGTGGAIVAWQDQRTYTGDIYYDIYAQHVLTNGVADPAWPVNGLPLCTVPNTQFRPAIIGDGASGAMVTWQDYRSGNPDIYSQRVRADAYQERPEPIIVSVRDVPNDQGGKVKVSWRASYLDTAIPPVMDHYVIFRSVPPNTASRMIANGAQQVRDLSVELFPNETLLLTTAHGASSYFWESVANVLAVHFSPNYSYVASTTSDSLPASNPETVFMVVGYVGSTYYLSDPDSGYSVDNLSPPAPTPFVAQYTGGSNSLHWGVSPAPDLASYRLWRRSGVDPDVWSEIAAVTDTGYVDAAGGPYYYRLAAVDVHGNISGYVYAQPGGATDGSVANDRGFWLGPASPNPAVRGTTFRFGIPAAGAWTLLIHDVQGRRVHNFTGRADSPGAVSVFWDTRDDGGRALGAAVYVYQLRVGDRTLFRPVTVLR